MTDVLIKLCYFEDCPLCRAMRGLQGGCAGHDEAATLSMLSLRRILLHNAEAAAMKARLGQFMRPAARERTEDEK